MLQVIKQKLKHLYQIDRSDNNSALMLSKNLHFHKKVDKINFEWKSMFFVLSHFNNFFGTHGHIPAIFNFWDLMVSALLHSRSPQHSKKYLQSLEIKPDSLFILWQSQGNLFLLQLERPKIVGTKSCLKKKLWLQTTFFF